MFAAHPEPAPSIEGQARESDGTGEWLATSTKRGRRVKRIGATFIVCFALAIVMLGAFVASSPGAHADVPLGSACITSTPTLTSTPATGTPTSTATPTATPGSVDYKVIVTLPTVAPTATPTGTLPPTPTGTPPSTATPVNANGLCVTLNGMTQSGQIISNAPGCSAVAPAARAANSWVWADWGSALSTPSANCVRPGESVVIAFKDGPTPPAVGTVTWSMANGTPIAGSAVVQSAGVGGVAEPPDSNAPLPTSAQSSSSSAPIYALFAGIGLVAVAAAGTGWYARRRRHS